MLKIGICGAHGTGKTTIAKVIHQECNVPIITNLMRDFWLKNGVVDFERLPSDIRTTFQKHSMIEQINTEDSFLDGFITDRTVLDQIAYTQLSSDMNNSDIEVYKLLCKERLKNYTHIFYLPIEFDAEQEKLRANIQTRSQIDTILQEFLNKWCKDKYITIKGSLNERVNTIKDYIKT